MVGGGVLAALRRRFEIILPSPSLWVAEGVSFLQVKLTIKSIAFQVVVN